MPRALKLKKKKSRSSLSTNGEGEKSDYFRYEKLAKQSEQDMALTQSRPYKPVSPSELEHILTQQTVLNIK